MVSQKKRLFTLFPNPEECVNFEGLVEFFCIVVVIFFHVLQPPNSENKSKCAASFH